MKRGLRTEGIFRLSGSAPEIEELCIEFDRPPTYGKYLELKDYDIHVVANVVKKYLRQLPDPPIPIEFHDKFIHFFDETYSNKTDIRILANMLQQLPREHFQLVQYIIIMVSSLQKYADKNLMNPEALAVIFAPACTGLELNLKQVPSWVKRKTRSKMSDMNHYVELNLKWTRIFTLIIEYSDDILSIWNDSRFLSSTVPTRPFVGSLPPENPTSFIERDSVLDIVPPLKPQSRISSNAGTQERNELYKVVIMRPRYSNNTTQKSIKRTSVVSEEGVTLNSMYSKSSISLGNLN